MRKHFKVRVFNIFVSLLVSKLYLIKNFTFICEQNFSLIYFLHKNKECSNSFDNSLGIFYFQASNVYCYVLNNCHNHINNHILRVNKDFTARPTFWITFPFTLLTTIDASSLKEAHKADVPGVKRPRGLDIPSPL